MEIDFTTNQNWRCLELKYTVEDGIRLAVITAHEDSAFGNYLKSVQRNDTYKSSFRSFLPSCIHSFLPSFPRSLFPSFPPIFTGHNLLIRELYGYVARKEVTHFYFQKNMQNN